MKRKMKINYQSRLIMNVKNVNKYLIRSHFLACLLVRFTTF